MESDLPQAVRFNLQPFEIGIACPYMSGYDVFGIFPVRGNLGLTNHAASKKHLDLMIAALGVVKLIDQTKRSHIDLQTGFFKYLSGEVFRQGAARNDTAARRTEQGASASRPRIHEEQFVRLDYDRPDGDTR